jgi:hypothetical protein
MLKRCLTLSISLLVVLALTMAASAQAVNLASFVGKTTFTPEETETLRAMIEADVKLVATTARAEEVRVARDRLVRLPNHPGSTAEFRTLVSRLTLVEVDRHLDLATGHRNRLALAITVSRLQTPEALQALLKLLPDRFPSVRYWAAKGLQAEPVVQAIIRGQEGLPTTRAVLTSVQGALQAESDPMTLEMLFGFLQSVSNDLATDVLVEQSRKKAVTLDLSNADNVMAMRRAVTALQAAHAREIRTEPDGKKLIVAAIGQILVQAPPHGASLELIEQIGETLSAITGQRSELAAAISEVRGQGRTRDSKLVDIIWVEQLGWIQQLQLDGQVEMLEWTPQKSVEAVRATLR